METLYILECDDNKWYVGKTTNIDKRFAQHLSGNGSEWTREYAPIRIAETRPITSPFDETNVTKELMKKYGVENVRGGAYTAVDLPEEIEKLIRHEFRAANDSCYKCGRKGHFSNKCPNGYEGDEVIACGDCQRTFKSNKEFDRHKCSAIPQQLVPKKGVCKRCKRPGHSASACYARTDVYGNEIEEEEEDTCHRCGRTGHWASKCYARKHIDGSDID